VRSAICSSVIPGASASLQPHRVAGHLVQARKDGHRTKSTTSRPYATVRIAYSTIDSLRDLGPQVAGGQLTVGER
jgi:hypothetical protein